jgi:hypothetical protein
MKLREELGGQVKDVEFWAEVHQGTLERSLRMIQEGLGVKVAELESTGVNIR